MVHGPCGGVRPGGACELGGPCPFVTVSDVAITATPAARAAWAQAAAAGAAPGLGSTPRRLAPQAQELLALLGRRPLIVADLPSPGPDPGQERALAAQLAGSVDAALLGDAPWARVQLPPAVRGALVAAEGVAPWCGLSCRDRNRAALQSELAGLAAFAAMGSGQAGIPAMHAVTGDHPQLGHRPEAQPVFDLDSTQLVALAAASTPLLISAAEAPAAPPTADRAARAAAKFAAGAQVLFVNHCSPERLSEFVAELADLLPHPRLPGQPAIPLIACVPLLASRAAADRITRYLHAPPSPELLATLDAPDPVAAAIAHAVDHAERLLAIPGIAGIDLSAPAGPGEASTVTAALATAGRALGAGG